MNKYNNEKNLLVESALTGIGVENYLFPFEREIDYEQRKMMSYYSNYMDPIIRSLVIPLFGQPIVRDCSSQDYLDWLTNVDGKGSSIEDFLISVLTSYKAHGNAYIILEVTDNPYLVLKKQTELYAYEHDEDNKLTTIEFINGYDESGRATIIGYNENYIYEYIEGYENKKKILQEDLGIIPVISLNPDIDVYPTMYSISKTCLNIYNLDSEQRDQERTSAFSILEIPNDNPDENVLLKKDSIIYVPTDSSRGSAYISPDANILKTLRESSESLVKRLWELAAQSGVIVNKSSSQSGVAYAYEFIGKNVELTNLARFAENIEYAIADLYKYMMGTEFTFTVEYTKTFAQPVSEVQAQINMLKSATEIGITFTEDELQSLKNNILRSL